VFSIETEKGLCSCMEESLAGRMAGPNDAWWHHQGGKLFQKRSHRMLSVKKPAWMGRG
jgi:hypothetical protein